MNLLLWNIDMIEKVGFHEEMIALYVVGLHGVVLVQVESDHILKAQPLLFVHANQFLIDLDGRGACGQPKYTVFILTLSAVDQLGYLMGHHMGSLFGIREYNVMDLLEAGGFDLTGGLIGN